MIPVNSTVNALYNSPVINNFTFNIVAPAARENVEGIVTYLKTARELTGVKIDKEDVQAVRAYSQPPDEAPIQEILEDTTTKLLSPKSGNYGQTTGTWSFTISGTKRVIKARITAKDFLTKYSDGTIRFYQGDRLKVRLKEKQIIEGASIKMEYEITEVLEYHPAHPMVRPS